jgi:uncharacterized protein YjiS (DUF1127 family)
MSKSQMEMIMSMISSAADPYSCTAGVDRGALAAAVKRLCAAFVNWRVERMAIAALRSMSDRELRDIGLTRSELDTAVRIATPQDRALA